MKKVYKIILSVIVIVFLLVFIGEGLLESKIENELKKAVPQNVVLNYNSLDLNILTGTVNVSELRLKQLDSVSGKQIIHVDLGDFEVIDISYFDYLIHKKISIDKILFKESTVLYYPDNAKNKYVKKSDSTQNKPFPEINISDFIIEHSNVFVYKNEKDSLFFRMHNFNFNLNDIVFNENTQNKKIPFDYGDYTLELDSIFAKASIYEDVKIGQIALNKEELFLNNFRFYNIYSRTHFDKIIPYEKDHFLATVDTIKMTKPFIAYQNDSILTLTSPKLSITNSTLSAYRNKVITDDLRYKPLYTKILRNLDFNLGIDSLTLTNGNVTYFEKARADEEPGEIVISQINLNMVRFGNIYPKSDPMKLDTRALFMKHAPLRIKMSFNTFDTQDSFNVNGEIDNLNTAELNNFIRPNLHAELNGKIDKIIFSIDGNDVNSNVNLKVKYNDFKITLLKKDGLSKNKFMSNVANTVISKDSKSNKGDFTEGKKEGVKRDQTKSIFNFLAQNIKEALLKAMT